MAISDPPEILIVEDELNMLTQRIEAFRQLGLGRMAGPALRLPAFHLGDIMANSDPPQIFIVEDELNMLTQRIEAFRQLGVKSTGFSSGEDFLSQLTPTTRGVVSLDMVLDRSGGRLTGIQVFERMRALLIHMPVCFHTAPFGNDAHLAANLARGQTHVDFFSKLKDSPESINDRLLEFLRDEPELYEKAREERSLLHVITILLTHAHREVLDGKLQGKSAKEWADHLGLCIGTIQVQNSAALRRLTGKSELDRGNAEAIKLAFEVSPLMERMKCKTLQALAAAELSRRLSLPDDAQLRALHGGLYPDKAGPADPSASVLRDAALELMDIDSIVELRALLKNAGHNMLELMLPRLPGERLAIVRNWLETLAAAELTRRLSLPDDAQLRALHGGLYPDKAAPADPSASTLRNEALELMDISSIVELRALLKKAGRNLLGLMLPRLPGERLAIVRNWLETEAGIRPGQ